jgi:hypothetical protein
MSRKFFYRKSQSAISIAAMIAGILIAVNFIGAASAQEKPQLKRPQQTSDEKPAEPKKTKKVKGPRAVGILQLSDGKATLIPVAILVEGKFYDASVYKAEPVPMALEYGTVYEAEQAGESQGLFTSNGAMHSKAVNSVNPWWGTGSYVVNGTEAVRTTHKAEDVPVGMDSSGDEPPRLTRKTAASNSGAKSSSAGTAAAPESSEKPDNSGTSKDGSSAGGSSSGEKAKKGGEGPSDKSAEQGEKKTAPAQTGAGGATGASSSGQASAAQSSGQASSGEASKAQDAENYYRPTLRRGKPTQAAPEEKEPAPKNVAAGTPATAGPVAGTKPVQLMAAISDSGGPDPQSYKFFWKEGEEDERRKQMLTLAGDELRAYIHARAKGAIGPKAPASKPATQKRSAAAKPAQPVFENIQFVAFDVWRNNQPVMILSADAHFAAEPGAASTPETYSITLVSRTDIYGSLRKLYSGVTDKFHLDITPRLELIDAVDADGDGRGELLFRETTDGGKGYVVYRATGDKLWKMFDSLGG